MKSHYEHEPITGRGSAYELAKNSHSPAYGEWTILTDGLIYVSCCDCGLAHSVLHKHQSTLDHVRFDREDVLTEQTREFAMEKQDNRVPLYRELLALREENAQLRAQLAAHAEPAMVLEGFDNTD